MVNIPAKKSRPRYIAYIGDDGSYWDMLSSRIRQDYQTINFEFLKFFPKEEAKTQALFIDLLEIHPRIIYIDFSTRRDLHMALAQMIKRDTSMVDIAVVGLVGEKEYVRDCISAGVDFIHVKCAEYTDAFFDPFYVTYPKEVKIPKYANAKMAKDVELIEDFRIGYMGPTSMHAEGNLKLAAGDLVRIDTGIDPKLVPSKMFRVSEISESDLYYDFRYAYDLDFIFVDEPELKEEEIDDALGETDEDKKIKMMKKAKELRRQRMSEYEHELKKVKKKFRDWVVDRIDISSPKKSKVLVVDRSVRILKEHDLKVLDQYDFSIRLETQFSETLREVDALRPSIIVLQFFSEFNSYQAPRDDEEELLAQVYNDIKKKAISSLAGGATEAELPVYDEDDPKNGIKEAIRAMEYDDLDQLSELVKTIKSISNYTPFLVVCNCFSKSAEALQQSYQYPLIIAHQNEIDMKTIETMATMLGQKQEAKYKEKVEAKVRELKEKDPQKYRTVKASDFEEKRYYVKKTNKLSHGAVKYNITINTLSESMLTFLSEEELEIKTFRLTFPVDMSIRIVPNDGKAFVEKDGQKEYLALIHSVNELDKKVIRQVVNEIFLAPKREKQEAERDAFKDLNKNVASEREKEKSLKSKAAEEALGLDQSNVSVSEDETPEET